jgi:hypothetical protein
MPRRDITRSSSQYIRVTLAVAEAYSNCTDYDSASTRSENFEELEELNSRYYQQPAKLQQSPENPIIKTKI